MASNAMIGQIRNGFWVCCRYSGKISQQQKGQRLYIVDIETTVAGQDPRYTSDLHSSLIEWASSRSPQSHSPKLKERKKRQKVGDGKKKRKEKKTSAPVPNLNAHDRSSPVAISSFFHVPTTRSENLATTRAFFGLP
mgnify:CR=1 FL=1